MVYICTKELYNNPEDLSVRGAFTPASFFPKKLRAGRNLREGWLYQP